MSVVEGLYAPDDEILAFGNQFHKAIEKFDKGQDTTEAYSNLPDNVNQKKFIQSVELFKLNCKLPKPVLLSDGRPAVEVTFSNPYGSILQNSTKYDVFLQGTIDRIHEENGYLVITDYKTTAYAGKDKSSRVDKYKLSFQLPFYVYNLLQSNLLKPEHQEMLKEGRYVTQYVIIFYNTTPQDIKYYRKSAYPDDFIQQEVPSIINTKIHQAINIFQLKQTAPHDGMTVYAACEYCPFNIACLHMGTEQETEFLQRFPRRNYNPLDFRK